MQHVRNVKSATGLLTLITFLQSKDYHFVTPTPATHARNNQRPGNETAKSLADAFGWSRPFEPSLLPRQVFDLLRDGAVIEQSKEGWKSTVRASTLDGRLFLHSAFPTVAPDAVFFGPDTYRFANAIKHHLASHPRRLGRALDVGCGSGAGGIVIASNCACDEVVLTDINGMALQIAGVNAEAAGMRNIATIYSDLFDSVDGEFDLIVANPPYLNDPLQRTYRHGGGELGSALSIRIVQAGKHRLSGDGSLLLYTGSPIVGGIDRLRHALEQDLAGGGFRWSYEEMDPDVFGEELETPAYRAVDRIAAVVLTVWKE